MKILVDTCVWSLALRRREPDSTLSSVLSDIISDGRAVLIGPVKQELLSGISNNTQFEKIKRILSAFQTILRNHIIANGKITQTDTENVTDIEISFNQHILNILEVSIFLVLGLLTIIFGLITSNATASIFGGILLVVGITYLKHQSLMSC